MKLLQYESTQVRDLREDLAVAQASLMATQAALQASQARELQLQQQLNDALLRELKAQERQPAPGVHPPPTPTRVDVTYTSSTTELRVTTTVDRRMLAMAKDGLVHVLAEDIAHRILAHVTQRPGA